MAYSSIVPSLAWMSGGGIVATGSFIIAQAGTQVSQIPGGDTAVSIGTGAGIGVVIGTALAMPIASLGTNWFVPWLNSRGLAGRVKALEDNLAAVLSEHKADKIRWEAEIAAKDLLIAAGVAELKLKESVNAANVAKITESNQELAESNCDLSDSNREMAAALMAHKGNIKEVSRAQMMIADGPVVLDGPKVLLVEDDDSVVQAFSVMLKMKHCRVTCVATVHDAVASLDESLDAVILDLNLLKDSEGHSDGTLVLKAIRDKNLTCRVVVTTGRDRSTLESIRAMNPTAILFKSFDFFDDLLPIVMGKKDTD